LGLPARPTPAVTTEKTARTLRVGKDQKYKKVADAIKNAFPTDRIVVRGRRTRGRN